MTQYDGDTGEILDEGGEDARAIIAADGNPVAKRSGHVSDVIRMLEDGQFNADVSEAMRKLILQMAEAADNNKGVAKGKVQMTVEFSMANGVIVTTADYKVTPPKQKRMGTALFHGESGSLGKNPPRQTPLFGDRAPRDPYAEQRQAIRD